MTHAANVFSGYVLAAAATAAYVLWVIRRGRTLGRDLGIGAGGPVSDGGDESRPYD
ncbi:hypothetical protein [Candidatus Poriferisodalis sp.]|uniref:hypothetical protein n=1 Tax=Candidatus Poriferisodalis sp. TaxID=3101277 RepID=UPI003B02BC39